MTPLPVATPRKKKGSRVRGQADFFGDRQIKAQIVSRMPEPYFKKLLSKGWDPGFFVQVEPNDYPTLAIRDVGALDSPIGVFPERHRCVVLSKGPADQNRRIVAQARSGGGGWVTGLWISLLRRQIKMGTVDVKAWCFETLIELEQEGSYYKVQLENWTTELLQMEQP